MRTIMLMEENNTFDAELSQSENKHTPRRVVTDESYNAVTVSEIAYLSTPYPYPTETERSLHVGGLPNARDLGGISLRNGGVVDCGKVIRSASPQFLTSEGADELFLYGVRTIIDLRSPGESEVEGIGHLQPLVDGGQITHKRIPIMSDSERDYDPIGSVDGVDDAAAHYVNYLRAGGKFVDIVETILDTASIGGATLLHCALGKDRTGVSISVILDAVGVAHEHIVEDYALTAPHLEHMVTFLSTSHSYRRDFTKPDWVSLAPQPHGITGMLQWIQNNYGDAAGFLRSHGLSESRLEELRKSLCYFPASLS